jgi:hypothetical protein
MDRHISAAAALAAPLLLLAALGTLQAEAAPDTACLSAPNGTAPQGQHWYYHLNRTSGQKCWYLRAAGSAQPKPVSRTADEQAGRSGSPKKPERGSSSAGRAALASASIEPLANEAAPVAPAPAAPQTASSATRQQSTPFGPAVAQPATAPPWPQPDRPQMAAPAVPMQSPETPTLASSQPTRAESAPAAADPAQPPAPDGPRKFHELKPVAGPDAVAADARKQSDVAAVSHTERAGSAAENAAIIAAAVLLAGCVCLVGLIARKRLRIYDVATSRRFFFRSLWRKPAHGEAARADRGFQQISADAVLGVPTSVALRRPLPREPLMNAAPSRTGA